MNERTASREIHVIPLDWIDEGLLEQVRSELEDLFGARVEIDEPKAIPLDSYNRSRGQYHSTRILDRLVKWKKKTDHLLVGIADVDLYVPSLNFVFGEASPRTGVCVISIVRLRQEFYRLPSEEELLRERTVKEAVHEIGHLVGLAHCPDPKCVMHFSNSLPDTDEKSTDFCRLCRRNV